MSRQTTLHRRTVLKTIGGGIGAGVAFSGSAAAGRGGLKRELAEVRSATAPYNNPANAKADGYHPEPEPPVCGMGYHWPNQSLLDFNVNKTEPEVMVYGESNGGNLILGAVEYVVPKDGPEVDEAPFMNNPPDSPFDHADPEWHILEVPPEAPLPFTELWTLHAWVHTKNPEGVFHPTNPRKQFHPEGCMEDH